MTQFHPPRLLRNAHLQSILASTRLRKLRIGRRARLLQAASREVLVECRDGTKLLGEYAEQPKESRGLVVLIHGWEGSSKSTYLLSAGSTLYQAGYSVFRLNQRDHGPSHHLNEELFNSTRLSDVLGALEWIQKEFPHQRNYLAGFSLGGNFSLRVAANLKELPISLDKVVAVCPVLNPVNTMEALDTGWWVYEKYFVRKWKRSLKTKLQHYPELGYEQDLLTLRSLREMNQFFVPRFTQFKDAQTYLLAYAIIGDALSHLQAPCHIIAAEDDPICGAEDLPNLAKHPNLTVETTAHGGHCGYVSNFRLDSWIDQRLLDLFNQN
ncbi:YheT family hydrolase [Litorivivens sp.]|uniref:YheT family hydrolase n=1 Tax=Litorivivens sp. TaxID=2020868 RepID=UPI0035647FE8